MHAPITGIRTITKRILICVLFTSLLFKTLSANAVGVEVWLSDVNAGGNYGTPSDPYICSSGAALHAVLASIPTNSTIHFMPGTYVTTNRIAPKTGWKMRGAGMDNTIIRMGQLATQVDSGNTMVIGAYATTDGLEISDLTIDCNLQSQTNYNMSVAAIKIVGNNTRISKVHAINWGTMLTGIECFALNIGVDENNSPRTNCVIESCILDMPAPVTHADGTTGISIFTAQEEYASYSMTVGAEIYGNIVTGITTGTSSGMPRYFNAFGLGAYQGYLHDNRALNLIGDNASCYYGDTWSGSDMICANNVFENVSHGVVINLLSYHYSRMKIIGNVIMPSEGGTGIGFYTGEPASQNTNSYFKNLIIKDNIIHPYRLATNILCALGLNGVISATVVNNILDGGETGADLAFAYWQLPTLNLNTFVGNYNLKGTILKQWNNANPFWQPGYEDTIKFTVPAGQTGWYRIMQSAGLSSGSVEIRGDFTDNLQTDLEFSYRMTGYTTNTNTLGDLILERQGSYSKYSTNYHGGTVTKGRIGSNQPTNELIYLDIYIPYATTEAKYTIIARGWSRCVFLKDPTIVTTPPSTYKETIFNMY